MRKVSLTFKTFWKMGLGGSSRAPTPTGSRTTSARPCRGETILPSFSRENATSGMEATLPPISRRGGVSPPAYFPPTGREGRSRLRARSLRGSESPPGFHSRPRSRFATPPLRHNKRTPKKTSPFFFFTKVFAGSGRGAFFQKAPSHMHTRIFPLAYALFTNAPAFTPHSSALLQRMPATTHMAMPTPRAMIPTTTEPPKSPATPKMET